VDEKNLSVDKKPFSRKGAPAATGITPNSNGFAKPKASRYVFGIIIVKK
jgi:hypothetical protein